MEWIKDLLEEAEQYKKEGKYYMTALIYEKLGIPKEMIYMELGDIYKEQKLYDLAAGMYERAGEAGAAVGFLKAAEMYEKEGLDEYAKEMRKIHYKAKAKNMI